jgi:hypothetical protein
MLVELSFNFGCPKLIEPVLETNNSINALETKTPVNKVPRTPISNVRAKP